MIIRYYSAPCGAGKTRAIAARAIALAEDDHKVLILQPTKQLIDKTVLDEVSILGPNIPRYVIHGDTIGKDEFVAKKLAAHLTNPPDCGHIVFATHQVLSLIPYFPTKGDWHLIIDECLQVEHCDTHKIPHTHSIITDDLRVDSSSASYGLVSPRNRSRLEQKARNSDGDELISAIAETLRNICNPLWITRVNLEKYNELLARKTSRLTFHSLLSPKIVNGFASVFIAAADIEKSGLFKLWTIQGVRFEKDATFAEGLRFTSHQNAADDTIYYFTDESWSRTYMEHEIDGQTVFERIIAAIPGKLTGSYVWQANKRFSDKLFGPPGQRLPNSPHGLNTYSHIDDVVFLSALNPLPQHIKFLKDRGLTDSEIRDMTYHSVAYQAVMRTSLRDPNRRGPRMIIVPDHDLAVYLHERFPGSSIEKIDVGVPLERPTRPGRPRKHESSAAKAREYRRKRQQARRQELLDQIRNMTGQDSHGGSCHSDESMEFRNENPIDIIGHFDTRDCQGTIYKKIKANDPIGYLSCKADGDFIDFLNHFHREKFNTKEDNSLISPAIFDPDREILNADGKSTKRGRNNIVYCRHLWLDFEDGDLTAKEFAELFPNVKMVLMNSFNHTPDTPRFRAVMLTTARVTADVQEFLFDQVVAKLKEAGYVYKPAKESSYKRSGLDRSKRSATSLFFLPCQAKNPKDSFIFLSGGQDCVPIDPALWIENGSLPEQVMWSPEIVPSEIGGSSESGFDPIQVDSAIAEWRNSINHKGEGNDRFFNLARRLKQAGMDAHEIKATLQVEAQHGRSPGERAAQIPSIMQSLYRRSPAS
jgi:hypothetical protein